MVTPHSASPAHLFPLASQLHYLARDYPDPNYPIHQKLHNCFLAHVGADEERLKQGLAKADFIKKGERALGPAWMVER